MENKIKTLLPDKIIEIIENENFPFYTFLILVLIPIVVLLIHLLEISNIILNNISDYNIDIGLILKILTIIMGIITIIIVARYYLYLKVVDYLLIAFFIFGLIGWEIWVIYYYLADPTYYSIVGQSGITGLNNGFHLGYLTRNLLRQLFIWGAFALFLQNVRMRSWKEYHLIMKIVIITIFIELIFWIIGDFILNTYIFEATNIEMWHTRASKAHNTVFSLTTLIQQILFPGTKWNQMYMIVIYIFIFYTYLTLKIEHPTRSIKLSRIIWMIFALFGLFIWLFYYFYRIGFIYLGWRGWLEESIAFFTLLQFILFVIIQILIPESLLITNYQIMQAKKMYKNIKNKTMPAVLGFDRVQDYIRLALDTEINEKDSMIR
jgi:hypothetical protein